jgi:hypothetical protein
MGVEANLSGIPDFDKFEIVKESTASVSGSSNINWTIYPHNLGYKPQIIAFMNDVSIASASLTHIDIPLPTWGDLTVASEVNFQTWIQAMVDSTNVYFFLYNATGSNRTYALKYLLFRRSST